AGVLSHGARWIRHLGDMAKHRVWSVAAFLEDRPFRASDVSWFGALQRPESSTKLTEASHRTSPATIGRGLFAASLFLSGSPHAFFPSLDRRDVFQFSRGAGRESACASADHRRVARRL